MLCIRNIISGIFLEKLGNINSENAKKGAVTIAAGVGVGDKTTPFSEIFDAADAKMYLNKKRMKKGERWQN